ncbi:MAG: riboflavin synthase [Actinobacteria bacterium]|nr:riboflavin synthase [Actinomycetota bacterium]
MFTGLVRTVGRVVSFADGRLAVESGVDAEVGDSVAVDGVCLTVIDARSGTLSFDVVPETLARVKPFRERVNLEPALRAGDQLGGHYVQGHVDGVGTVRSVEPQGDGLRLTIDSHEDVSRYCIEKGSIAVDGVSLTIAALTDGGFELALVPHTIEQTTLSTLRPGDGVNLEVDVLGKYVERLLGDTMQR